MSYKIISKDSGKTKLTLEVELAADFIKKFEDKAVQNIGQEVELKGFRKGKAPKDVLIKHVGPLAILEEQASLAVSEVIPEIIQKEKIDIVTRPNVQITKLAPENPISFKMIALVFPSFTLPKYKDLAKEVKDESNVEVTDQELDTQLEAIRKNHAKMVQAKEKLEAEPTMELNDEFAKQLGPFEDLAALKKFLKEKMTEEKAQKAKDKRRIEIMQKIVGATDIEVADELVEDELHRMMHQFHDDIRRMGVDPKQYFEAIKKTEADIAKDWRADAISRVKMNFILPAIAKAEKVTADKEAIEHELGHIKEHDPKVDEASAKLYIETALVNENVFKFLESQK